VPDSEDDESALEDVDGGESSASATGEVLTRAPPIPSATASAPTRPMCLVYAVEIVDFGSADFARCFARNAAGGSNSISARVGRGNEPFVAVSVCCCKYLPVPHRVRDLPDIVATPVTSAIDALSALAATMAARIYGRVEIEARRLVHGDGNGILNVRNFRTPTGRLGSRHSAWRLPAKSSSIGRFRMSGNLCGAMHSGVA
jgi:hypothetical protein